jgi:hypothetical protein
MKLTTLSTFLLCLLRTVTEAAPANDHGDAEAAASRQITRWQRHYNEYIDATLKSRHAGCTKDNIVYRQEW